MMIRISLVVALAVANPAMAREVPVSATGVTEDRLPSPLVQLGDVQVLADVTYAARHGFRPLRLDLYAVPAQAARPLVVFVHGGGWTTGHKRATGHFADFPGLLADLARRGFVVASVEYRLSGEAGFPGAVDDVKAAVAFLRANGGRFGIDAGRVALWGGSAGAHLASMAALTDAKVQALVGWYGPYDIEAMLARSQAAAASGAAMSPQAEAEMQGGLAFFGCTADGCPPGVALPASPLSQVDAGDPPTLLLHGTADTLVPPGQSEAMAAALRKAGVPVQLVLLPGADHGWTSATGEATVAASRRAVQVTFDWLQEQLVR